MPKTLLVDTNRAAVPIYQALCGWGHDVWVVGGRETEPLARMARHFVKLDYSDADRLSRFIADERFDHVVPGCTDLSYKACSDISKGRLPCIDTPEATDAVNTKHLFRSLASSLGIPVPRVIDPGQALGMESIIVKPVDSFSGRGMQVLRRPDLQRLEEALRAARQVSKSGAALIEEYLEGQLYSHSAFVWDGRVVADFIVQEDCTTNPFTVDTSRVVETFPEAILQELRSDILRVIAALKGVNGLVHTQFILRNERYWIIEVTRRCPGDIYALLIQFATGYPYAASYAAQFVGGMPAPRPEGGVREWIIRHTITSRDGAVLWGYQFSQPVDLRLLVPLAVTGEVISPSPYGRAAVAFFRCSSKVEQNELYQFLLNGSLYRIGLE